MRLAERSLDQEMRELELIILKALVSYLLLTFIGCGTKPAATSLFDPQEW